MEMLMWIIVLAVLLIVLFLLVSKPGSVHPPRFQYRGRLEFYTKGMDAGFSLSEINLLWSASIRADLENPPSIYGSLEELDMAINQIAGGKKFSDRRNIEPETVILKKLFDYRKKVEMNRSKYKSGLKSSRNIAIGQKLTIRADGVGVYSSKILENEQGYLTISIPVGDPLPGGFSWRKAKLNVYFWRKEDAGYFFQTRVIEKYYDRKNLTFHIYHSDNILRSQKRRSLRAPARISARLFPLKSLDDANIWMESSPGLSCLVVDLSEDGAALRIGGRGKKNQPFKLQFKLRDEIVVVTGVVKRVQYDGKEDDSILHVEFLPPPETTRMILLSYVFDIDRSRAKGDTIESADSIGALNVISGLSAEPGNEAVRPEDEAPVPAKDNEEAEDVEEVLPADEDVEELEPLKD
jgi:c-di-GMP-binding flagellar brake protein YcgR